MMSVLVDSRQLRVVVCRSLGPTAGPSPDYAVFALMGPEQVHQSEIQGKNLRRVGIANQPGVLSRTWQEKGEYEHAALPVRVTVSGHLDDEMHPRTLNTVLRQAGLK
jgi:hypothetical protein